jgi:hypothetical protein
LAAGIGYNAAIGIRALGAKMSTITKLCHCSLVRLRARVVPKKRKEDIDGRNLTEPVQD